MIACYVRVSTTDQNPEAQRNEIAAHIERAGIGMTSVQWFVDRESGKNARRAAFQALQGEIRKGKVSTVLCWKLDRLARSVRDGVNILSDWTERGVRVVSITQGIDLSGAFGQAIAALLFAVAEMELANIRERQQIGIAAAKQRGVYQGRKAGTTKANPARALELRSKGLTDREIAAALGVTERTVYRYLRHDSIF
jgi:DNA invertase Pin-like site-specific DNA recombinase